MEKKSEFATIKECLKMKYIEDLRMSMKKIEGLHSEKFSLKADCSATYDGESLEDCSRLINYLISDLINEKVERWLIENLKEYDTLKDSSQDLNPANQE